MAGSLADRHLYDERDYHPPQHSDRSAFADVRVGSRGVAAKFYCIENASCGDHRMAEQV